MKRIILASTSPRRKELFKKLNILFSVYPTRINEKIKNDSPKKPSEIVKKLALRKCLSVSKKIKSGIIIGADTIVVLRGKILGKPKNIKEAGKMLLQLSGTWHNVYTGIAIVDAAGKKSIVDYELSRVKMRKLSVEEIKNLSRKHLDKAGGYAVQEKSDKVIEKIIGDYYNVVGLPIRKLKKLLAKFISS